MSTASDKAIIFKLKKELALLKAENLSLKHRSITHLNKPTVKTPPGVKAIFDKAEKTVGKYFSNLRFNPTEGTITINDQRYVLVRASALSYDFLNKISELYSDRGNEESMLIGKNILFDLAHVIGMEDAKNFHKKMKLKDPISKLSAGPVHFAFSGWAFVEILPESRPIPNESYYLKYNHPFSFEADSWIRAKKKSLSAVCIMNAGYSSGWCEASFGMPLTAVEISCKAKGDKQCMFIMAPPDKIESYLPKTHKNRSNKKVMIPSFLERKKMEEQVKKSLNEKEVLLKEIHHRVKNNMQIISSLLNLQSDTIDDPLMKAKFSESINRIRSMAMIHELLYQSKDFSKIKFAEYLNLLSENIRSTYTLVSGIKLNVSIRIKSEFISINKAIPAGLLVNELVSNAYKHAFNDNKKGLINLSIKEVLMRGKSEYQIVVQDNGIGMLKPENKDSLGMQLIYSLTDQLEGKVKFETKKGTKAIIHF